MSSELQSAMPDPNSNVQLPEGTVPAASLLGGDVTTQFTYRPDATGFETALEAVRKDQEMICGYELVVVKYNTMDLADEKGQYVEVFVTFAPKGPS